MAGIVMCGACVACARPRLSRYEEPDPEVGRMKPGDPWGDTGGVHHSAPWPAAKRGNHIEILHHVEVKDPYRWLEDENDPDVQQWMTDQHSYARNQLDRMHCWTSGSF